MPLAACQSIGLPLVSGRQVRVGWLWGSADDPTVVASLNLFRSRMAQHGWVEGRNLTIVERYNEGDPDLIRKMAAELASMPLDAVVTNGGTAATALKNATASIPIVVVAGPGLVALGLVESLAHPGGNVTGVMWAPPQPLTGKQLDLLKSVVPSLMRVAVLFNPTSPAAVADFPQLDDAAGASSIQLLHLEVSSEADFEPTFAKAQAWRAEALMVLTDTSPITPNHARIAAWALQNRLPDIVTFKSPWADDGFLMTYGGDSVALLSRAADYVDRIVLGTKPGDLPVEGPATLQFAINVKTAQTLGLSIPPDIAAQVTDWVQ
jgi:putative ABC transport system substrate-binding protein